MHRVSAWGVAGIVGLVGAGGTWTALEILGYEDQVTAGLGVGAGVGLAALTGRWIEKRRRAQELLAKFDENNRP
jgi:hypothetical protein